MFAEEKRYVQPGDKDDPFPTGEAELVDCANCGRAILIVPGAPRYCNGKDATGCQPTVRE